MNIEQLREDLESILIHRTYTGFPEHDLEMDIKRILKACQKAGLAFVERTALPMTPYRVEEIELAERR